MVLAQQSGACRLPDLMPVPRPVPVPRGEAVQRQSDGGYLLALSWSPQYCATVRDPASAQNKDQCVAAPVGGLFDRLWSPKPQEQANFGWVLHGLWPQSVKGANPQWCRPVRIIPKDILRQNFCVSPSVHLMQYQWAKHGSCMSTTPQAYFAAGHRLYRAMRFPDMTLMARSPQNSGSIRRAFARQNAGTTHAMYSVHIDRQGWLREVRLCLNKAMRPTPCPLGQQGLTGNRRIMVRPAAR